MLHFIFAIKNNNLRHNNKKVCVTPYFLLAFRGLEEGWPFNYEYVLISHKHTLRSFLLSKSKRRILMEGVTMC